METTNENETTSHPDPDQEAERATAAASGAERRTVEEWAKAKGMVDMLTPGVERKVANPKGQRIVNVSMRASGITARAVNHRHGYFLGAKLANKWPIGHECTEAEFDKAIAAAEGAVVCR